MSGVAEVVDVAVDSNADDIPSAEQIGLWVRAALRGAGRSGPCEVAVRIVDEAAMQALNREYRGKDKPTNVLSFPAGDFGVLAHEQAVPLGDIAICAPVVAAEAHAQGKAVGDHWAHMAVHGALHLIGFDHISDSDAARMEALEVRILAEQGVPDPYRVA